jgi:hypothetical protein
MTALLDHLLSEFELLGIDTELFISEEDDFKKLESHLED